MKGFSSRGGCQSVWALAKREMQLNGDGWRRRSQMGQQQILQSHFNLTACVCRWRTLHRAIVISLSASRGNYLGKNKAYPSVRHEYQAIWTLGLSTLQKGPEYITSTDTTTGSNRAPGKNLSLDLSHPEGLWHYSFPREKKPKVRGGPGFCSSRSNHLEEGW